MNASRETMIAILSAFKAEKKAFEELESFLVLDQNLPNLTLRCEVWKLKQRLEQLSKDCESAKAFQRMGVFDLCVSHLKFILLATDDAQVLANDQAKVMAEADILAGIGEPRISPSETEGEAKEKSAPLTDPDPTWRCANPTACGWSGPESELGEIVCSSGPNELCCPKCGGPIAPLIKEQKAEPQKPPTHVKCLECNRVWPVDLIGNFQGAPECPSCKSNRLIFTDQPQPQQTK